MSPREPIAIIGIGCRYAGGITDPGTFWSVVLQGTDAIGEIPADRMEVESLYDPNPSTPGKMITRWGGFLDRIDEFDAEFFGISPREAERMDPQQRILCELAWEAVEDAGIDPTRLEGTRVGVYVGQWTSDFEGRLFGRSTAVDFHSTQGTGRYATSGRISYVLGLRGPSLTIDTACSSSLAAIHLACQAIHEADCEAALAGGVNLILQPHITVAYSQSRMMASQGRCRFGDADGDGYVRSEGAGLVLLKRLSRAVADGDRIYAVIRGSAVNNDGRSSGVMGRPSQLGHEEMLRSAYQVAGIDPARVGYVEAHGTGTRAGDPVEVAALGRVLGKGRAPDRPAWIGSVKTNIGHTEAAAGVAGLIKAALALQHQTVPPSLHFDNPNPLVPWSDLPLRVPQTRIAWPAGPAPRIAAVNSFGISGSNAHVILEEAPAPAAMVPEPASGPEILVLSGRTPVALGELAAEYARLFRGSTIGLRDLCASAALGRAGLPSRAAFVAGSLDELVDKLERFARGDAGAADATGTIGEEQRPPRIGFVFPGQGSQSVGMARELLQRSATFQSSIEASERSLRRLVPWSLTDLLTGESDAWLDDIAIIQPVLVAVEIALAAMWSAMGITPAAVVGHSMGEVAAAHVAGILSLDDALAIACRRSTLMKRTRGAGGMGLVELTAEQTRERLKPFQGALTVAAENAPRSTVVSGSPEALEQLLESLQRDGVFAQRIKVDVASHSPQMGPLVPELIAATQDLVPMSGSIPLYSTVTGERFEGERMDASYWGRNLGEPVRFRQAVDGMATEGIDTFLEVSPHPILLPAIEELTVTRGGSHRGFATLRRDEPEHRAMLSTLGALYVAGYPVDFHRVYPAPCHRVALPLYPWQRQRYWAEEADLHPAVGASDPTREVADPASREWLYQLAWREVPIPETGPRSANWLIVGDDATTGELAAALQDTAQVVSRTTAPELASCLSRQPRGDLRVVVIAPDSAEAGYVPIEVLQAILPTRAPVRCWFITRGSQSVDLHPSPARSVDQAALWGAARVVAEEHPEIWGGLVDLDGSLPLDRQATLLARHLIAQDGEDQVALRGSDRLGLRLVRFEPDNRQPQLHWKTDGAYLITGGLGGIGLELAGWLARAGVHRLILLGRTALPERARWLDEHDARTAERIAAIRALEAQGVSVQVEAIDVADETQLKTFAARYRREAWPPIRGIFHLAVDVEASLAESLSQRSFDRVMRSKLRSAQLLDQIFPDVERLILFSSILGYLPQVGTASYAAANAGLEAIAANRLARGGQACAFAWGSWDGVGQLRQGTGVARAAGEMARQGILEMSARTALRMIPWLVASERPVAAAARIDWTAFQSTRGDRWWPLLQEVAPSRKPLLDANHPPAAALYTIEQLVVETVSTVLKFPADRLDKQRALGSYGLNSLMAMELRNRLEAALERPLSATIAWNYPTIAALAGFLAGAARSESEPALQPAPVAWKDDDVVGLSDQEAIVALRAARGKPAP